MALSDRVIVMNKGRIEQVGGPHEIYQNPSTSFVAGFVGISNFLRGQVEGRSGGFARLHLAGGSLISVPDKNLSGEIQIALRPHSCTAQAASAPVSDDVNTVKGKLARVTYFGERSEAAIDLGNCELLVYLPLGSALQVGDTVLVTFPPTACIPLPV